MNQSATDHGRPRKKSKRKEKDARKEKGKQMKTEALP